jgi:hypothetical protein
MREVVSSFFWCVGVSQWSHQPASQHIAAVAKDDPINWRPLSLKGFKEWGQPKNPRVMYRSWPSGNDVDEQKVGIADHLKA